MGENKISPFLTPEGLMMISVAIFFDAIGPAIVYGIAFIPYIGGIISYILGKFFDLTATLIIGGWMLFRSSIKGTRANIPQGKTRGKIKKLKKLGKVEVKTAKWAKRLKWLRPLLIFSEWIPAFDFMPDWTIAVCLELKYS